MRVVKDPSGYGERYFADDPSKKVYAVDAYMTLCKCFKVEAKDDDEAEEIVRKTITDALKGCEDVDTGRILANLGFSDAEEMELSVSGEANVEGDIEYS